MKKVTFAMLIMTFLLFLGLGLSPNQSLANTTYDNEGKRDIYLNIMTCNKIQYDMVKAIVGDKHNVEFMFINEEDSFNFKYSDETTNNLKNMDLFLFSGNDYEPWISNLSSSISNGEIGIIDLSRGIRTIDFKLNDESKVNPYYWTGIDEYKIALYNIKSAIQDKDPLNRELYEDNYNDAVSEIDTDTKTVSDSSIDFSEYTFIALDDFLDYFYKNIKIDPIKLKSITVEKYIAKNKLNPKKVIILKNKDTKFEEVGYTVINLERFNGSLPIEKLIINNYSDFNKGIQGTQK